MICLTASLSCDQPIYPTEQASVIKPVYQSPGEVSWEQNKHTPRPGVWISREEVAALPVQGPAWNRLKSEADLPALLPNLSDQNDPTNVRVMAKALVYARLGDEKYRQEVIRACMKAIGTERGGRTLSLARELASYVAAADLVKLPPDADQSFRSFLREALGEKLEDKTLRSTHEGRPNNWGTHAGATRVAIAVYLGDARELSRTAQVFKGYLGDRQAHAGFTYKDLSWQADPTRPVGINPKGTTKVGRSIDGILSDDQRRGGSFVWPPPEQNYVYTALQGALVQAEILYRAGYDTWNWEDKALLRAFKWLYEVAHFPAKGDDTWLPHLINYHYGTDFSASIPSRPGKNMGWTDWTHASRPRREGGAIP